MSAKSIDYVIPRAPESLDDIAKTRTFNAVGRTHTFVKTHSGQVYRLLPRRPLDLTESWESNQVVRREVCKLTGWAFNDLKAAIDKRRQKDLSRQKKLQVDRLRRMAATHGYRVVKIKEKAK